MLTHCQRISPGTEVRRVGPGISPFWHYHAEIEVDLVIAGRGAFFLDQSHYDLSPGALVWMLPNQSHRLLPGPDLRFWTLTYPGDRVPRAMIDDIAAHSHRIIAREDALALDRLFLHLAQEADDLELLRHGAEYALRSALRISMSGPEAAQPPLHPAVLSAIKALRETPDIPNVAALAARCGVSAVYLRELLPKQTGRGFVEWRNRLRLERFQLLYPKSENLLAAALEAGFGSYTQFYRVFVDIVGTTPGDWAKGDVAKPPPIADFARAPERPGSRMAFFTIGDLPFDSLGRWIGPSFADLLARPLASGRAYRPLPSHVAASYDLQRFADELIREIAARDAEKAANLRTLSSRFDIFASYANSLSIWHIELSDLALLLGVHIYWLMMLINRGVVPPRSLMQPFAHRVAAALEDGGSFGGATRDELQRATAALCMQGFVLREAGLAARSSDKPELMTSVCEAGRRTLTTTFGLDPDLRRYLPRVESGRGTSSDEELAAAA